MTRKEAAIEQLKFMRENMPKEPPTDCDYTKEWLDTDKDIRNSLDMAIKALEQESCKDKIIDDHYWKGFHNGIRTEKFRESKRDTCEDAVSRKQALECVDERIKELKADKEFTIVHEICISGVKKHILELPSVTPTQRWIPVSERLPKEYADVICCTDAKEVFIASYLGKLDDGTECFDDDNGMMCDGDVVAWMPLPEPYKADMES